MKQKILYALEQAKRAVEQLESPRALQFMESVAQAMSTALDEGHKILVAGNGGSLCDAMHFAEELTGQFRQKRRALPAIALSDAGHITCTANDMGFDQVFSRGIEALGQPGDVFVALSTSGNSANILRALECANRKGLTTVSFLGKKGGLAHGLAHFEYIVEGFETSDRIQEAHMLMIHILIEMIEEELFSSEEQVAERSVLATV